MNGTNLTLAAVAALTGAGVLRQRRGNRAVTSAQMKAQGCTGPYFHTTRWSQLQSIAEHGLQPGCRSNFGGWYENYSRGRIFLARGADAAIDWFWKLHSNLDQDELLAFSPDEADELLPTVVPVMLRVDARDAAFRPISLEFDRVERLISCSFFTTQAIPPERIWFYDGSSEKWRPIVEWDHSDPMVAFREYDLEFEKGEVAAYLQDPDHIEPPRGWFCWDLYTIGNKRAFAPTKEEAYEDDWKIQAPKIRRSLRGTR